MIKNAHIPKRSVARRLLLRLLVVLTSLAGAITAHAQTRETQEVCLGETKHYWVDSTAGNAYTWKIDGAIQQAGTVAMFTKYWNVAGTYLVSVQETSAENCSGQVKDLTVHVVAPPSFTVPVLDPGYCVEDITQAIFHPGGTYYVDDISPPRPDYYLLPQGSNLLNITNLVVDCSGDVTIAWEIDFAGPAPPDNLTGTGQISAFIPPEGIQFPVGNNVVTWTVTDACGCSTSRSVTLVVLPRPDIGDIPP